MEHRGRFTDRIIDGLMLICEESGWQLPAHNSQERGGKRAALADVTSPIIDLFAAETGALLAVTVQILGIELDAAAPGIVRRIDLELERRIFEPYLTRHFWWMGKDDERMNNWTAWCTQNVLIGAFARPLGDRRRRAIVAQAAISLDTFLKDYGEDGACEEGVLYYRHAGLCLFNSLVVLGDVAPEAFGPLWREPKIRGIAEYIVRMHVEGRRYFNFADSSALVDRSGAREYLFGRAVCSTLLADFAAADWAAERQVGLPGEINLFYRLQHAWSVRALAEHRPDGPLQQHDCFLPSVGLMVARDAHFALAAKAGGNGDSHNHNDVGSVILYKNGVPVLIDVGVESYTAKTFSAQRYDIWTMQSAWHNLPSFDGVMQRDGDGFAARNVNVSFERDVAEISMEIAGAYPPEAGLRSYRRSVRLRKSHSVEIVDDFDGDRAAELSLMFAVEPELAGGRIVLRGLADLVIEGASTLRLETIEVTDARLLQSWPDRLYRVLVPFARRLRIVVT